MTYYYTTAQNVYNKTGLTSSEVDLTTNTDIITDAEAELESITGKKFTSGNSVTEFINAGGKDIFDDKSTSITVLFSPIQSITEFKTLDTTGSAISTYGTLTSVQIAAGTFYTTDYWLETMQDSLSQGIIPYGKITLKTATFPEGTQNIKVSYTYGYTSVPVLVRDLATCLAGIRAWINFLGGSYNRLDSYSIPQQTVSKGSFYERGKQNIEKLNEEALRLLSRIGIKPKRFFTASGRSR